MTLNKLKKYTITSSGFRAVLRAGERGPLKAVAAPLTPRPRGTIYEDLPFILDVFWTRLMDSKLKPLHRFSPSLPGLERAPAIAREASRPTRGTP